MKQQSSNNGPLFDEPDFTANGGGASFAGGNAGGPPATGAILQQEALLNKFNNTVVLKKGQLTQVLKNTMANNIIGGTSAAQQMVRQIFNSNFDKGCESSTRPYTKLYDYK